LQAKFAAALSMLAAMCDNDRRRMVAASRPVSAMRIGLGIMIEIRWSAA
jgi:hypothetical protein